MYSIKESFYTKYTYKKIFPSKCVFKVVKMFSYFRPDFVHEEKTCIPKICEINARFTANGFLMTYYGCDALDKAKSLYWPKNNLKAEEIHFTKKIVPAFKNKFNTDKPIVILRNREVLLEIN